MGREDVFNAETAAGQVLDYLKGMRQLSVNCPFVLLSTYNGTVIARFDEDEGDNDYTAVLQAGLEKAKTEPKQRLQTGTVGPPQKKEGISPNKPAHLHRLRLSSLSTTDPDGGETPDATTEEDEKDTRVASSNGNSQNEYDYQGRSVKFSQVF